MIAVNLVCPAHERVILLHPGSTNHEPISENEKFMFSHHSRFVWLHELQTYMDHYFPNFYSLQITLLFIVVKFKGTIVSNTSQMHSTYDKVL